MIKFLKKQFIKLLLYVVIIGVITLSFSHYNLDKNTLLSIISLITSIFIAFMGKTWIDDYKLEIDRELENYKIKLSSYTLVTKLQYDLEFKIYTEIYEMMFLLYIETDKLHPLIDNLPTEKEAFETEIINRLNRFEKLYNKTSNTINKYRPFYSNEIFEILRETRDLCLKESKKVSLTAISYPKPFDYIKSIDRKKEIKENLEIISNLIKKRIETMKIIEN
ncbi:hypothetical protein [Fusobacterium mortiferum]|uniref:hypothetical protein n=1 Tax=Fusobacterium mortiferum TaxID=850 RepID=UPI00356AA88A